MITLDAGVLIGLLNSFDAHHERAVSLFSDLVDDLLYLNPITEAEVLVRAVQVQRGEEFYHRVRETGVNVLTPPPDAGVRLAQMRAETGLKLPDCCVILTAQQSDSRIATFDARLARAARGLGIEVVPEPAAA